MGEDEKEASAIRLGLIGCADIAVRRVLPAVSRSRGVRLAVSASRSREKAEKVAREFGGQAIEGYDRALETPGVDAVYIPLPSGLHAHWIERALEAGKHVLAEKPLTTSARDTERLHGMAASRGLVLRENYMFLGHRLHDHVAALLREEAIGEVHSLHAAFAVPPRPEDDIRLSPQLGGGALLDTGGYPVRCAIRFLGTDLEVAGATLRSDSRLGVDLAGSALLRTPGGTAVCCEFGLAHHYTSGYRFLGSKGRISVDHVFTTPVDHTPVIRIESEGGVREEVVPVDDQFANSVAAFVEDIRHRHFGATTAARVQARIVDGVREAARRG